MSRRSRILLVLGVMSPCGLAAAMTSVTISPGEISVPAVIESRCPTFSWTAVEGAASYELVVYDLEMQEGSEPVLSRSFPGAAFSWTPAAGECFERGRLYAWSVQPNGPSIAEDWSEPRLFELSVVPGPAELAAAVELIRTYLEVPIVGDRRESGRRRSLPGSGVLSQDNPVPATVVGGGAALTVEGEVRTVDSSDSPRSWGKGRPGANMYLEKDTLPPHYCENGSIKFGLTKVIADWGSAAEACPAGSWVCTAAERGTAACTSLSPTEHGYRCDGSYWDIGMPGSRLGWIADSSDTSLGDGEYVLEAGGAPTFADTCYAIPVWCCTE